MGFRGGSIKLYSYVGNNPLNLRAPSGHCAVGGLINVITFNVGVIANTLAGRKIDYCSGLSGAGRILAGNALAFAEGCALGKAGELVADLLPVADVAEVCELCFPAGTPLMTRDGLTPIEKIKVGDEVLFRNPGTGKVEYRKVTALVAPHLSKLLEVYVLAEANPLQPTLEHPFFVRRAGGSRAEWVPALNLQVGDLVLTAGGTWTEVLAISPVEKEQVVYNFEVEENHDYFVGASGLLVHNGGPCNIDAARQIAQPIIDAAENLECVECTTALANALSEAGFDGVYVEAESIGSDYMLSDFASSAENSITENGFHSAVAIESDGEVYVFDNFANGVPYSQWVKGLLAPNEVSVGFWGAW